MNPKLSPEQTAALQTHPDRPLRVEDPTANRVYILLEEDLATRAMKALEEQETWSDLQESIAQADDGQTLSLAEADEEIRNRLGIPKRA